ncbi:MAG: M20 metallopeptidase family protein [Planctomycetota bacterium]|jgi:amidohydrolase
MNRPPTANPSTPPDPAGRSPAASAGIEPPLWRALQRAVEARADRLVKFRRRLHATPEPSEQEIHTTALVASTLRDAGLEPRIGQNDVGVMVDLGVSTPDASCIALRSELDAVMVNDEKQVPYASTVPGLCHACGHDVHTSVNLAAALAFAEHADQLREAGLRHDLRFVFQPAEEAATGARMMIKQGAIDGVAAMIALHVDPFLDVGVIGLRPGALTSGCKSFHVAVRGRSGHTARPHEAIDPIPAATELTSLLYQLAPRSIDSRHPLALTVASIQAGSSYNGIPDEATLKGTLRTTRVEDMEIVQRRMEGVVAGVAQATGCEVVLEFVHHSPPTDNDPAVITTMTEAAIDVVGAGGAHSIELPSLGAEDFAFYQELIPGAMVRLGAGLEDGRARRPLHSSHFDINEAALGVGTRFMMRSALLLAIRGI